MVCWLRFLKKVSDMLKEAEPNIYRRKQLAIEVLKELEKEEGHNPELIGKAIEREGRAGMIRRALKRKRKKDGREDEEGEKEEEKAVA